MAAKSVPAFPTYERPGRARLKLRRGAALFPRPLHQAGGSVRVRARRLTITPHRGAAASLAVQALGLGTDRPRKRLAPRRPQINDLRRADRQRISRRLRPVKPAPRATAHRAASRPAARPRPAAGFWRRRSPR